LVPLATGLLAFAGSYGGQLLARRSAKELETRSRREEALRVMRWAAELAVDPSPSRSALGVAELKALTASDILTDMEQALVDAAMDTVLGTVESEVDDAERTSTDGQVEVRLTPTIADATRRSPVPSETAEPEGQETT
jgi:hypothetical protein